MGKRKNYGASLYSYWTFFEYQPANTDQFASTLTVLFVLEDSLLS